MSFNFVKNSRSVIWLSCLGLVLSGCANSSANLGTQYVSPLQYQPYDCTQLASESQRLQSRVVELGGRLDQASSNDKALMGVTLVLFWPAAFALGGTKAQEAEYSRLKGEVEAVQISAVEKKCQLPATRG